MRRTRTTPSTPAGAPATARWEALGTTVVLRVLDPLWLPRASALLTRELDSLDRACSRFRPDSDLSRVNAHAGGRPVRVAPLLVEALQVALRAAELTHGDVDPTVGAALVLAGYDRDWRLLEPAPAGPRESSVECDSRPAPAVVRVGLRSGYTTVELDPALHTVRVPRGVVLDLGATAKAWAADRARPGDPRHVRLRRACLPRGRPRHRRRRPRGRLAHPRHRRPPRRAPTRRGRRSPSPPAASPPPPRRAPLAPRRCDCAPPDRPRRRCPRVRAVAHRQRRRGVLRGRQHLPPLRRSCARRLRRPGWIGSACPRAWSPTTARC